MRSQPLSSHGGSHRRKSRYVCVSCSFASAAPLPCSLTPPTPGEGLNPGIWMQSVSVCGMHWVPVCRTRSEVHHLVCRSQMRCVRRRLR